MFKSLAAAFSRFLRVLAKFLRLRSVLMKLDFPTFDRPAKAISGISSWGSAICWLPQQNLRVVGIDFRHLVERFLEWKHLFRYCFFGNADKFDIFLTRNFKHDIHHSFFNGLNRASFTFNRYWQSHTKHLRQFGLTSSSVKRLILLNKGLEITSKSANKSSTVGCSSVNKTSKQLKDIQTFRRLPWDNFYIGLSSSIAPVILAETNRFSRFERCLRVLQCRQHRQQWREYSCISLNHFLRILASTAAVHWLLFLR